MFENDIKVLNEEDFTGSQSQVFYSKKSDFNKIDEICKENEIVILDTITPYFDNNFSIQKLPKVLKVIVQIIILLIIIFFLIQNYI